jgi:hypothetical protein
MLDPETRRWHDALAVAHELRRAIASNTSALARYAGISRQAVYRCLELAHEIISVCESLERDEPELREVANG